MVMETLKKLQHKDGTWIGLCILMVAEFIGKDEKSAKVAAEQAAIEYLKYTTCYNCKELLKNCKCRTPCPWPAKYQEITKC